eukprot:jgi/Chlat1/182/Chrsp1S03106
MDEDDAAMQDGEDGDMAALAPGAVVAAAGPGYAPPALGEVVDKGASTKGPPLLAWMRRPLEIGAERGDALLGEVPRLEPRLASALEASGITALFPVQQAVWSQLVRAGGDARDLCVCAPTGSGKTLSYALPIVQVLSQRVVRRLRALVVLPTRDLALQVKAVFDAIAPAVGLSVGLVVGRSSIAQEASELVVRQRDNMIYDSIDDGDDVNPRAERMASAVDILVATPGRLMSHLEETPGFTLEHLRYLVVDETDRLLRQAYQDWLPRVIAASSSGSSGAVEEGDSMHPCTIRKRCVERGVRVALPRVVKLLLSATLTRDPTKIMRMELHRPLYIAMSATDHRYKVPKQLLEFKLVCPAEQKPVHLIALLHELKRESTLVFTASVDATHRLYTLLSCFDGLPARVVEFSSRQTQKERSAALEAFRSGRARVLVASDAMTRGMDVEDIANVVNYDVPVYAKTYVHRVGRTARAGRSGRAFTLLRRAEVKHFKGVLRKADNNYCRDYTLQAGAVEELLPRFASALARLKERLEQEKVEAAGKRTTTTGGDSSVMQLLRQQAAANWASSMSA